MSGAGTCSTTLDFKTLNSLYEKDFQIVVIEKAGYGFSDITDIDRKIDTIIYESRESLKQAGIELNNLILFPHSMSALEAIYLANQYPDEIKAIIGLYPAIPEAYTQLKVNIGLMKFAKFCSDK